MKFTVMNNGLDTYEVHLHWESKDKIKKIFGYGFLAAAGAATAWYVINKTDDKTQIE